MFYQLTQQLNRESKDTLWWWIIGLSDLAVHCKQGDAEFTEEIVKCNEEVNKNFPSDENQQYVDQNDVLQDLHAGRDLDYKEKDLF